jgi:hypothetical protein
MEVKNLRGTVWTFNDALRLFQHLQDVIFFDTFQR